MLRLLSLQVISLHSAAKILSAIFLPAQVILLIIQLLYSAAGAPTLVFPAPLLVFPAPSSLQPSYSAVQSAVLLLNLVRVFIRKTNDTAVLQLFSTGASQTMVTMAMPHRVTTVTLYGDIV
ncbi:UNVERIFIED_CONTAM: hypothetical protein FKN15_042167 [Acipenser sinensis]